MNPSHNSVWGEQTIMAKFLIRPVNMTYLAQLQVLER